MPKLFSLLLLTLLSLSVWPMKDGQQSETQKVVYNPTGLEATISGTIGFKEEIPAPKKVDMGADPKCREDNPNPTLDDLIVNSGGLANVFVYIQRGGAVDRYVFETPSVEAVLYHRACHYSPRVLGLQTGQMLVVLNSDLTTHNTHPVPKANPEWNSSQTPGDKPIERSFKQPELFIPFKCNQHPWQRAFVSVLTHPFFSVSGEDGTYRIDGVPPGTYILEVLHEKLKSQTKEVSVVANEVKTIDFHLGY
jgi:hypothetical protein